MDDAYLATAGLREEGREAVVVLGWAVLKDSSVWGQTVLVQVELPEREGEKIRWTKQGCEQGDSVSIETGSDNTHQQA